MKAQILKYWDRVRSSFWFLPALMAGAAVGLALATVALDEEIIVHGWLQGRSWVYTGGARGPASSWAPSPAR